MDFLGHKMCVTNLMSVGSSLLMDSSDHDDKDLEQYGIRKDVIEALLKDLQDTFNEWHARVPDERVKELSDRIFNASPELNLKDSRA